MHSLTRSALLLFLVSFYVSMPAAPANPASHSPATDERVPFTANRRVKVDMTKQEVISSMRGKPDEMATADIWVYWNFNDPKHLTAGIKRPAMIIFFTNGKASVLRILAEMDVRATLAQYREPRPAVAQK